MYTSVFGHCLHWLVWLNGGFSNYEFWNSNAKLSIYSTQPMLHACERKKSIQPLVSNLLKVTQSFYLHTYVKRKSHEDHIDIVRTESPSIVLALNISNTMLTVQPVKCIHPPLNLIIRSCLHQRQTSLFVAANVQSPLLFYVF